LASLAKRRKVLNTELKYIYLIIFVLFAALYFTLVPDLVME